MWPVVGAPDGRFYFDDQPNLLDQFLVNMSMATGAAAIKADPATAKIFRPPAMVNPGVYPKPIPFGGMGKPVNQNGFFDHFPITKTSPQPSRSDFRPPGLPHQLWDRESAGRRSALNPSWELDGTPNSIDGLCVRLGYDIEDFQAFGCVLPSTQLMNA
jgi:hypothetical protein